MINIFKSGGLYKKYGKSYSVKAINNSDVKAFLADGWVLSLDEVKATKKAVKKAK